MVMSGVRNFLSNLSSAKATFLFCAAIGLVTGIHVGGGPGGLLNGMFAFYVWIVLGLFFGGIAWIVETVSLWKSSLTRRSTADKDPALEALRRRYARGEIDENLFESMLHRLKEV
jgi:uncharacterized membrane protein